MGGRGRDLIRSPPPELSSRRRGAPHRATKNAVNERWIGAQRARLRLEEGFEMHTFLYVRLETVLGPKLRPLSPYGALVRGILYVSTRCSSSSRRELPRATSKMKSTYASKSTYMSKPSSGLNRALVSPLELSSSAFHSNRRGAARRLDESSEGRRRSRSRPLSRNEELRRRRAKRT